LLWCGARALGEFCSDFPPQSAIRPTNQNLTIFQDEIIARSPRPHLPVQSRKAKEGFSAAEFRISLCEMRRQRRCCPCPNLPVRAQRVGTPFEFAKDQRISYHKMANEHDVSYSLYLLMVYGK